MFFQSLKQEWKTLPGRNQIDLMRPAFECCGFVIRGVRPEQVKDLSLRVNGLSIVEVGEALDEEGKVVSAGQVLADCEQMSGPSLWQGVPLFFRQVTGKVLHIKAEPVVQLRFEVDGMKPNAVVQVVWLQEISVDYELGKL